MALRWFRVETADVTGVDFLEIDPDLRGHWFALLGYCAQRENGGRIEDAQTWGDKKWDRCAGVRGTTIRRLVGVGLAVWEGGTLVVKGYDSDGERMAGGRSEIARNAAKARWEADAQARVEQSSKDVRSAMPDAMHITVQDSTVDPDPPVVPPPGGQVESKPKRARKRRAEYSPEVIALTAEYVGWFNAKFGMGFEPDAAETQQLVAAWLAVGKWTLADLKLVSVHFGEEWGRKSDMQSQVRPSAMLRASKFGDKLAVARKAAGYTGAAPVTLTPVVPGVSQAAMDEFIRTGRAPSAPPPPVAAKPKFPVTSGRVQTSGQGEAIESPGRTAPMQAPARGGDPKPPPVAFVLNRGGKP